MSYRNNIGFSGSITGLIAHLPANVAHLILRHAIISDNFRQLATLCIVCDYPELVGLDEIACDPSDDIWVLQFSHYRYLIEEELFLLVRHVIFRDRDASPSP